MSPASDGCSRHVKRFQRRKGGPWLLFKTKVLGFADTAWKQVNDRIIYGAMAECRTVSGPSSLLDRGLFNSVQYEYKLVAVITNKRPRRIRQAAEAMPPPDTAEAFETLWEFPQSRQVNHHPQVDHTRKSRAMLNVYSIPGQANSRMVKPDNVMKRGFYRVAWTCKTIRPHHGLGPYIYRFTAPGLAKAKIMIVMK